MRIMIIGCALFLALLGGVFGASVMEQGFDLEFETQARPLPLAVVTNPCGTYTVASCFANAADDWWITGLIPESASVRMPVCSCYGCVFCPGGQACYAPVRPEHINDVHVAGPPPKKRLYCGTDANHVNAYWYK